jgi:anti-anti-sigma regulatory factor
VGSAGRSSGARPRNRGALQWLAAPSTSDHACAGYSSDAERARLVVDWFVAGLELGQRCLYVSEGPAESALAELPAVLALDAAVHSGAIVTASFSDLYEVNEPMDPERRLGWYAESVGRAVDDGYSGLRVIGDMSPLIPDPQLRREHLRWEQLVDRYMAEHPFAALCLYDRRSAPAVDAIVCSHPLHGAGDHPFSLYAVGSRAAALTGELDASVRGVAAEVLEALPDADETLDVGALDFLDRVAATVLRDVLVRRRAAGRPLRVIGATHAVRGVWDACGFDPSLLTAA